MRRRSLLALGGAALLSRPAGALDRPSPDRFRLQHPDRRFGGLSALHLDANGRDGLLLTDRGTLIALQLHRDAQGTVLDAEIGGFTDLRGPHGSVLRETENDSEGLAVAPDGTIYICFEGRGGGRVWRYAAPAAIPEPLPRHPDFAAMPVNGSLEALALDPAGHLWTLPETPTERGFPLYRFDGQDWTIAGHLPRAGRFLPVALDFGPDGRAWLLERDFIFPIGFASRLSRLHLTPRPEREILWQSRLRAHDNLEGLSVTRDATGQLRATMVSDDNFLPIQRSELVELRLPEG